MTRALRTGLTLAVLAGLGWYVWKFETGPKPGSTSGITMWKAAPEDVVKLELSDVATGLGLTCERQPDGTWWITKPVKLEADGEQVEQVVRHLATPEVERRLDASADLAPFGLAPGKARIAFTTKQGNTHAALLGGRNPTDTAYFALPEGTATPYTIATWSGDAWKKTVADLRQKTLVRLEPADVVTVVIDRPKLTGATQRIELAREGADGWRMVKPAAVPADRYVVDGILNDLKALKADTVIEEGQAFSRYRLDQPHARIILSTKTGTGQTVTLARPKAGGDVYASSTRLPFTLKLPAGGLLDSVLKGPDDFRERLLLQADKEELTALTLEVGGFRIAARGSKDVWTIVEPAGKEKAAGTELNDALFEFIYVRAESFGDDAPNSLKPFGLSPARASITLTGEKDRKPFTHTYALGSRVGDHVWCRFGDLKGVVKVRKDLLDRAERLADKIRTAGAEKAPEPKK